jgi:hypothetical protein
MFLLTSHHGHPYWGKDDIIASQAEHQVNTAGPIRNSVSSVSDFANSGKDRARG